MNKPQMLSVNLFLVEMQEYKKGRKLPLMSKILGDKI